MKRVAKRPLAADRTVDMFTGLTTDEVRMASVEEVVDHDVDRSGTNEDIAMRGLHVASSSDGFGNPTSKTNQFRVVKSGDHYYLEQLKYNRAGVGAYAYASLMIKASDLAPIAKVLVDACASEGVLVK